MSNPHRIKTAAIQAPTSQSEAEELLAEIGTLQRRVTRIEADMNEQLSDIKDRHEKAAQPLNADIESKFRALHVWAEANRHELLKGKLKTVKLSTGELLWRTTPPSVRLTKQDVVLESLRRLGLTDLIRTKEEVNKEAILADPERVAGIKGISISQGEDFVAKPYESQIERAEPVKKAVAA